MSLGSWIDDGRAQIVVLWGLGFGLLAISLAEVSLGGIGPDRLPVLATTFFGVSAAYMDDDGSACDDGLLARLRRRLSR